MSSDGNDYSATVQAPSTGTNSGHESGDNPTGSPIWQVAPEGGESTFYANTFGPLSAFDNGQGQPDPMTYTWQFQNPPCNLGCLQVNTGPSYAAPVTSTGTAYHTFPTSGTYSVILTATDTLNGQQAQFTFSVTVPYVQPEMAVAPGCPATGCAARTVPVGTTTNLAGTITHAGTADIDNVYVDWGDGSTVDTAFCGGGLVSPPGGGQCGHGSAVPGEVVGLLDNSTPLTLTPDAANTRIALSDSHTYNAAGIYYATITVSDQSGASFTKTVVETVTAKPQVIQFSSPPAHRYGYAPAPISASGGASGQPVVIGSATPAVCSVGGAQSAAPVGAPATTRAEVSVLGAGTCTLAADQAGTTTYAPASEVTVSFTVEPALLTISPANEVMTYGGPVPTLGVTYHGFVDGDTASVVSGLSCQAFRLGKAVDPATAPAGTYTITCAGASAANYTISYGPDGQLAVNKAHTVISLSSRPGASVWGQTVTFTAKVSVQSPGSGSPSGKVEFEDGPGAIAGCSAQPVGSANATASCTTAALAVGSHSVTATYGGDPNFTGSRTGSALSQTVGKAGTVTLAASPGPVMVGQALVLTATARALAPGAGTPTGTVTFYDGGRSLGTAPLGSGEASLATSSLAVGPHSVTASYAGDGDFNGSTSATFTQYVNSDLTGYPTLTSGAYDLSHARFSGGYFVDEDLAGASLTASNFRGADFSGTDLVGADLSKSNFVRGVNFTDANLSRASITKSNLRGANLSGADLSGASITKSNLRGANLRGANLSGANLTGANLKGTTLGGVVWGNTTCPDGTVSNADGGSCLGHL